MSQERDLRQLRIEKKMRLTALRKNIKQRGVGGHAERQCANEEFDGCCLVPKRSKLSSNCALISSGPLNTTH